VHGCFWHGHDCWRGRPPKTNVAFWEKKLEANRERDVRATEALRARRLRVLTVWQCELDDVGRLKSRLANFIQAPSTMEPAA
jgi:DNA mismatch endonuclease (patch repair protein)